MPKPPIYHDLIEACASPGCPVCRLVQRAVSDHIRTLLSSEGLLDPKIRHELRHSLGFCPAHTWLMLDERLGDALGVSILYQDILGHVLRQFQEEQTAPSLLDGLRRRIGRLVAPLRQPAARNPALAAEGDCLACRMRDSTARLALGVLVDSLDETALPQALAGSAGLCLPHLAQALQEAATPQAHQTLLAIQQERLEALRGELGEFIRKNDYRFGKEPVGAEGNAWKRAAALSVGEKGAHF